MKAKAIFTLLALLAVSFERTFAQERTLNDGTPGTIRGWPMSGKWEVLLTRNKNGELTCLLVTGRRDQVNDEFYAFGLRHLKKDWSAFVLDRNSVAASGETISIKVDSLFVGRYPVAEILSTAGLNGIRANLTDAESKKVFSLLVAGESASFLTQGSTYTVKTEGIAHALLYLSACDFEADSFRGVQ